MRRSRSSARWVSWSTGWSMPTCASGRTSRSTWPSAAASTGTASSETATRVVSTTIERRLIDSVGRESQKVIDSFDRRKEARELADGARNAVAAAAAVSAGGVGLGAIVTIAATTAAADVTGHHHGVGDCRARVLHSSREAREGQGRDAPQDCATCGSACRTRCTSSSRRRSAGAAIEFAKASRRTAASSGPRGKSCEHDRAGTSRDRRGARLAARADRKAGCIARTRPS